MLLFLLAQVARLNSKLTRRETLGGEREESERYERESTRRMVFASIMKFGAASKVCVPLYPACWIKQRGSDSTGLISSPVSEPFRQICLSCGCLKLSMKLLFSSEIVEPEGIQRVYIQLILHPTHYLIEVKLIEVKLQRNLRTFQCSSIYFINLMFFGNKQLGIV